ncbi:uncharacterized protein LOC125855811 [Solanum stenotomum]|uniref:uncharacterized protein LOC125855811 n=1 Tax=Solanum stenotomum TaxID=172797 RepID=UPI0020D0FF75|nr:uncharacterized protein LOC125855811 [Solanum stenotomum]
MRYDFNKFRTWNIGYTDRTILKWFSVGLADELRFSFLVSFQPLSPESFETKSGMQPLSLVSTHQGCSEGIKNELIQTPWLLIAAKVKKDLLLSFQHMKRKMEEAVMAQMSVVARFGKILLWGSSSIGKDSLKLNSLTETTLRKMKGSFHTDVPPSYMDYVENRVVENLGQEYVQGKELYYVKLSDKLRTESIVSCKCTVAKDHNKIQPYKIELNRVRHMVADMSILGKSSDLRLFVYTKKIKKVLSVSYLLCSNTEISSTGEVAQEANLKMSGILSQLQEQTIDENLVLKMIEDNLKLIWDHCLHDGSSS